MSMNLEAIAGQTPQCYAPVDFIAFFPLYEGGHFICTTLRVGKGPKMLRLLSDRYLIWGWKMYGTLFLKVVKCPTVFFSKEFIECQDMGLSVTLEALSYTQGWSKFQIWKKR